MNDEISLKPQAGPQDRFLASNANICIYGGAAGGGKTYGLLLDPLRYKDVDGFGAVIFRKNSIQIYNEGGLLDESLRMYSGIDGAELKKAPRPQWIFGGKGKVSFAHIEAEVDLNKWQGSQIAMIGYDELTHFSEHQFFYMLSRNRSTCGVKPYVRATCNPDADSWVAKFIDWWIDPDTGYPIKERSGKKRWMIRRNEVLYWADKKEELWEQHNLQTEQERQEPKSVAFIMSTRGCKIHCVNSKKDRRDTKWKTGEDKSRGYGKRWRRSWRSTSRGARRKRRRCCGICLQGRWRIC